MELAFHDPQQLHTTVLPRLINMPIIRTVLASMAGIQTGLTPLRASLSGMALDGSECPSYLVCPQRDGQSYTLLDTSTADTLVL